MLNYKCKLSVETHKSWDNKLGYRVAIKNHKENNKLKYNYLKLTILTKTNENKLRNSIKPLNTLTSHKIK